MYPSLSEPKKKHFFIQGFLYNASPDKKLVKKLEMIKDVYV